MDNIIKNIQSDLKNILNDWKEICKNHSLLDKDFFLEKIHNHILKLEKHNKKLNKNEKIKKLLTHILHTPQGAPVASSETLYTCAKAFANSSGKNSSLYKFLKKSLTSSNAYDNFLFSSLSFIGEELEDAA